MLRPLLIIPAILLIAHDGFTVAQERFELTVPKTTTRSTAELTASSLTINHQGKLSVYSRETRYDVPGHLAFRSKTLGQIILWPSKGTGSMQIAAIPRLGLPQFRLSQMKITRVAAPIGTVPAPPRSGPVDTTRSYRLTNAFLGESRSLAANASKTTAMSTSGDFANQSWRFVAVGTQTYRLTNVALGNGSALTAKTSGSQPTMEPIDLRSKAQLWRLTAEGTEFRLTNEALGTGWSLDGDQPLLAASGNASGQMWTLTKSAVDTTRNYRLTNAFLGPGQSLDTDRSGKTGMAASGDFDAQSWRFVAAGAQTYRLMNVALGNGFSLTAKTSGSQPTMEPTDLRSQAQLWRLTSWGLPSLGTGIRLTSETLGAGWSLDNDGGGSNEPLLAASGNFSGQHWTLTELATAKSGGIVGTWQEIQVATNRPRGITFEIRADQTFRQTEPGKPDRVGTVELIGDRLSLKHSGAISDQYLVKLTADRIDFRELSSTPCVFYWRRTATGPLSPKPPLPRPRRISRKTVPNPPLEPVTIELANKHSEELWVVVSDLRDVTQAQRLKIPSGKSASIKLERDAGARAFEVWEIPITGRRTTTEEREIEVPPQQLYDISVYELFVQSIAINRTKKGAGRVEDVNRAPKSVGLIKVPPGDRFKGGKTDIYAAAKRQKNPGTVRRIDPAQWRESAPKNDPLQNLLPPRR